MRSTCLLILLFASGAMTPLNAADKEAPAPVVLACVDQDGQLVSAEIAQSSGFPEIDEAALKIARASKFSPGEKRGKKRKKSCVKLKVKFVVEDEEQAPPAA
jgi:TonB family protein